MFVQEASNQMSRKRRNYLMINPSHLQSRMRHLYFVESLNQCEIEEKEMEWLELAEALESLEEEEFDTPLHKLIRILAIINNDLATPSARRRRSCCSCPSFRPVRICSQRCHTCNSNLVALQTLLTMLGGNNRIM
jgi:hypothetical protein